jgi:hypothetical protein
MRLPRLAPSHESRQRNGNATATQRQRNDTFGHAGGDCQHVLDGASNLHPDHVLAREHPELFAAEKLRNLRGGRVCAH